MRITSKGQVTIPKRVRDHLCVGPGSEVDFVERGDAVHLVSLEGEAARQTREAAIRAWTKRVAGTIDLEGMTTDEFVADLRGPREDLGPR